MFLFQAVQPRLAPSIPDLAGIYYCRDDKNCTQLPKAPIAATKMKGMDLFVNTGGYSNLGIDVTCLGAGALTRILASKPTFYARGIDPSSDVMLIQLAKKKDSRTFRTSSGSSTVENKQGFRKADIRKISVTKHPDGILSLSPESDLKPGEYLLVVGSPEHSFDFGIDSKK